MVVRIGFVIAVIFGIPLILRVNVRNVKKDGRIPCVRDRGIREVAVLGQNILTGTET